MRPSEQPLERPSEKLLPIPQSRQHAEYLDLINDNPHELEVHCRDLLVVVSGFFRDPDYFAVLSTFIKKRLLAGQTSEKLVRVWVPGCATGEEAYSLAILLREAAEQCQRDFSFQIFATDLDGAAIEVARKGVYPEGIAADLSTKRLAKFFTKEDGSYRINKAIRGMAIFAN